ncbi:MAG: 50S ribosomal protein L10 [Lentimicrobium sp.]
MRKEDKNQLINVLAQQIKGSNYFYVTDASDLSSETTNQLRRLCFKQNIRMKMVKNSLLKKAMERSGRDFSPLYDVLNGHTAIFFSETGSAPAQLIQDFRQRTKNPKPLFKGAYIEESFYVGEEQLDALAHLKTKNELIGDIISLLQSPARNVISALQSGGGKLAGIVKTLSEK